MLRPRLGLVVVLLCTLLGGPVLPAPAASAYPAVVAPARVLPQRADSLAQRLGALPHVVRVSDRGTAGGRRMFVLGIRQPVDHQQPRGASFVQQVVLLHRGADRPTVLVTDGYRTNTDKGSLSPAEPTTIVDGNQVAVEHRFFGQSRPARASRDVWARTLTIRQAAADHHRVVAVLRRLYRARWISTGASKSGMAATYFRRFHPDDVTATVAYVAPNDVVDDDDAYQDFLDRVGTPACRDAVVAVQRRVLGTDRGWFLERTRQEARDLGWTWQVVGSSERAWESAVVDVAFAFWQYQHASLECSRVPAAATPREQVWEWLERVSPLTLYADQPLRPYVPYYLQAAAQLGAPEPDETRIGDLLRFPGSDVPLTFVPAAYEPVRHDATAMPDVDRWVRTRSTRMIFLYGGNDPWSAEPFSCGADGARRGCHRLVVAGGTHSARLLDLPRAQQRAAYARIRQWAGVGQAGAAPRAVVVPPPTAGRGSGVRPL